MTKKDYILIAEVFHRSLGYHCFSLETAAIDQTAAFLAVELARDNPKFDRDRFMDAVRKGDKL